MGGSSAVFWVNLLAIVAGPVLAVVVARLMEASKVRRDRRMALFSNLMRTRRTPMSPEHVGALNLVEIEFAGDKEVIAAWLALFTHFGTQHVRHRDEEEAPHLSDDELEIRRAKFLQRLYEERQRLLAKLLHAMGRRLNYKAEQLEIFEGGYTPQGWVDDETQLRNLRSFLNEVALGKRLFPVGIFYQKPPTPPSGSEGTVGR